MMNRSSKLLNWYRYENAAPPPEDTYVTEDGTTPYVTEDGSQPYVPEDAP